MSQPGQQDGAQQQQANIAQRPQQQQTRSITLQPSQITQLAKQCNLEIQEARKKGTDTPEGQEHLRKAQRIKTILMQYQQQNQQQGQLGQQTHQSQSGQQQQQHIPQQATQQTQGAQNHVQSPQLQQSNALNNGNQNLQPQNNVKQQVGFNNNSGGSNSNNNNNRVISRVATSSPSPLTNNVAGGAQAVNSPNSPQNKTSIQQLQNLKQVLSDCQKKLKDIDEAKKTPNLSQDTLTRLLQQEQTLKDRFANYRAAALSISQNLQKQQQLQQLQQNRAQNLQGNISNVSSPLIGQPQSAPQQAPLQQGQAIGGSQSNNNIGLVGNTQNIQQRSQSQNSSNFQFQQSHSPQLQQQQQTIPSNHQQNQIQHHGVSSQIPQSSTSAPLQQQQLSQQAQIPKQVPLSQPTPGLTPQQQQQVQLTQQQQVQLTQQQQVQLTQQQQQQALLQAQQRKVLQSRTSTPQPQDSNLSRAGTAAPTSASPNTPVTNVNAAARPNGNNVTSINAPGANVFKSAGPTIPITSQLNVKPPVAAHTAQSRPSLTGGNGIAAPALTTPALLKLPPYEMQSDRVLSKRKLSELVKTVGADEGDGETTIDGDVEELLLDLADEFVTGITSFACRLAKHRKSENLEARDIQLHLEKNWNIRIPGYSSDEIRSVRKWPANSAHTQRIQGIGISKSVDQNK